MAEQSFAFAGPLADRHYVIEHGQVVECVEAHELDSKRDLLESYLRV